MEIKKKIAVWCALFALLVALVPPSSAKANTTETTADDVKYADIEDFMHGLGYSDFSKNDNGIYLVYFKDNYYYVVEFVDVLECKPYFARYSDTAKDLVFFFEKSFDGSNFNVYKYWDPEYAKLNDNYSCLLVSGNVGAFPGMGVIDLTYKEVSNSFIYASYIIENILYSDLDVYMPTIISGHYYPNYENVIYESSLIGSYSFELWCTDADLNCAASSNESSTVIPYSYNSYWHIVRKTSSGKWLLTTVGNSVSRENASDYTFMYSEDMGSLQVLNLYSGEDTNGYLLNVRQYEYDTDGWKVRTYEAYDARETDDCIIDLGAGSGVDDTRVLAYTNVDIYDQNFELVTSASTEYTEPTTPESPSEEITPTPTNAPSGGGVGGGGARPGTNVDLGVDLGDITLEDIPETIKNIKDTIKEFLGLVGVVPLMIGAVFGFLPDWCLWVLGVSFAFVGILLVVKVIRG